MIFWEPKNMEYRNILSMKADKKCFKNRILFLTILLFPMFIPGTANSGNNLQREENQPAVLSVFNPKTAKWNISWPGRISQYDLVYLTPPCDPLQGFPLGNGETGVLVWCENSKIIAVVNKSDLWDDAAFTRFGNWNEEEEDYSTTQRHACMIIIDFRFPVFNVMYLSDFKAKLNLADASLNIRSVTPFGEVNVKAFVDHETGIFLCDLGCNLKEEAPVEITAERYGSRTFSHWYSLINRDASIGLARTETIADTSGIYITQTLSTGKFAAGGKVIDPGGTKLNYSRIHSRCASMQLSGNTHAHVKLAFTVTSPGNGDPVSEVRNSLASAQKNGIHYFQESNAIYWESIWNRSFMDYGDDYLNSLWYLTMYYTNASQGGKYPGRFNNGLWSWSRDVQNWNFYFHWNQQQLYWPVNAAGFHELVTPYLEYRFNSLPHAQKDAKEIFNAGGAFISDVTERRGYNSTSEKKNHTPVAEIALDFWKQYRYTCDKEFLKDKALPFMIEAARFYESLFVRESDGLYHAKGGTGYEGWIMLKDGLTELVYARVLFPAVLEALKSAGMDLPESEKWKEIAENLAPLPVIRADENTISAERSGYILRRGFFKGEPSPGKDIYAAGWGIKENKMLTVYYPVEDSTYNYGFKLLDGIFPSVPSSPVFPSGMIGLAQKETPQFRIMTSTALLYGNDVMGWDPVPVVLARLGLAGELAANLANFPGKWQIYCNGWGHIGGENEVKKDAEMFFRTNMVRDAASPKAGTFPFPMWPFRHMSMESMSLLATAMNESLMQSYDGTIRVFPAFPANRTGRFTLHAEGGFIVSSEINDGIIQWICIQSLHGYPCKLEIPWPKASVFSSLKKGIRKISENTLVIPTRENEVITVLPEGGNPKLWSVQEENPQENEQVRYHASGKTRLGIPRMY